MYKLSRVEFTKYFLLQTISWVLEVLLLTVVLSAVSIGVLVYCDFSYVLR